VIIIIIINNVEIRVTLSWLDNIIRRHFTELADNVVKTKRMRAGTNNRMRSVQSRSIRRCFGFFRVRVP